MDQHLRPTGSARSGGRWRKPCSSPGSRLTIVDRVRTGERADLPDDTDLGCAACGAITEPVYETPRLLGYTCGACGWTGEDPAVQADRRAAEARDFAAKTIERTVPVLRDAMEILARRGKKAQQEGVAALAAVQENLEQAANRLRTSAQE